MFEAEPEPEQILASQSIAAQPIGEILPTTDPARLNNARRIRLVDEVWELRERLERTNAEIRANGSNPTLDAEQRTLKEHLLATQADLNEVPYTSSGN